MAEYVVRGSDSRVPNPPSFFTTNPPAYMLQKYTSTLLINLIIYSTSLDQKIPSQLQGRPLSYMSTSRSLSRAPHHLTPLPTHGSMRRFLTTMRTHISHSMRIGNWTPHETPCFSSTASSLRLVPPSPHRVSFPPARPGRAAATTSTNQSPTVSSSSSPSSPAWPLRSILAGTLRESDIGQHVTVCGWVDAVRDLGGKCFFTVRDHSGVLQFLIEDDEQGGNLLKMESCVRVSGEVIRRASPNPKLPTGQVEVRTTHVEILSTNRALLPFSLSDADAGQAPPPEETRLKHRVLDLRRAQMQRNLRLRHLVVKTMRRYLEDACDFVELETPILTKSTPEGARDYLVPSRNSPGSVYALPQSPQLFKQSLMMAGFDRYYQVRPAEDPRRRTRIGR